MDVNFPQALTLARFAVFFRPESHLYLPGYKGAAFRGGFGYVFKSIVCPTHDIDCLHARLGNRCIYSDVFETPVPSGSTVMRKYPHAPHPFVLTPPLDRRSHFTGEHELCLELTLVGRAIDWIAYFICTLEELGRRGVGPQRGRYRIERVESLDGDAPASSGKGTVIYDGMRRKVVGTPHIIRVGDTSASPEGAAKLALSFITPARIVSGERLATSLPFVALFRSLLRRLALLTYFHCGGTVTASFLRELIKAAEAVQTRESKLRWRDWKRFSTRQQTEMKLGGLVGEVWYEGELSPFLPYLRAGVFTHVGKATSFGLGKYMLNVK